MQSPFFSIIIPAYNCRNFILDAIKSIERQTFQNWELIVVDDCSTDGTYEVLKVYIEGKSKLRLLRTNTNFGSPGKPRDIGIKNARGKFIGFLDGDDMYHPKKLQRHFDKIIAIPAIEFIHTSYNILDEKNRFLAHRRQPWFEKVYRFFFKIDVVCLLTNPFCISTTIIKSDLIKKYQFGIYPKLLSAVEDWYTWNRMLNDQIPVIYYDASALTDYRWVENSISGRAHHRCEYQSIIFFAILLYTRKIKFLAFFVAVVIRCLRIFFTKFFRYAY